MGGSKTLKVYKEYEFLTPKSFKYIESKRNTTSNEAVSRVGRHKPNGTWKSGIKWFKSKVMAKWPSFVLNDELSVRAINRAQYARCPSSVTNKDPVLPQPVPSGPYEALASWKDNVKISWEVTIQTVKDDIITFLVVKHVSIPRRFRVFHGLNIFVLGKSVCT